MATATDVRHPSSSQPTVRETRLVDDYHVYHQQSRAQSAAVLTTPDRHDCCDEISMDIMSANSRTLLFYAYYRLFNVLLLSTAALETAAVRLVMSITGRRPRGQAYNTTSLDLCLKTACKRLARPDETHRVSKNCTKLFCQNFHQF